MPDTEDSHKKSHTKHNQDTITTLKKAILDLQRRVTVLEGRTNATATAANTNTTGSTK